ncbi:MAG: hypothetical protein ACTSWX_00315 [Promethearchaeota archaeon]
MILIEFDEKASDLMQEKSISSFLLDVDFMEEPCVQVFSPVIRLKISNIDGFEKKTVFNDIEIIFSNRFMEYFGDSENLLISTKGLLRKRLFVKNIEPIIKNVCKID